MALGNNGNTAVTKILHGCSLRESWSLVKNDNLRLSLNLDDFTVPPLIQGLTENTISVFSMLGTGLDFIFSFYTNALLY